MAKKATLLDRLTMGPGMASTPAAEAAPAATTEQAVPVGAGASHGAGPGDATVSPAAGSPAEEVPAKKAAAPARKAAAPKKSAAPVKKAVTPATSVADPRDDWTDAELAAVRAELEGQAGELRGEIDEAESTSAALQRDSSGGGSGDEADAGTKTFEREHEITLANNSRDLLQQVERALGRIDVGTYGRCEMHGDPIPKERLQAFPRATLCLRCKQRQERR